MHIYNPWLVSNSALVTSSLLLLSHSVVSDSATPWTAAHQAPLSMGFSSKSTQVGCHALLQGVFPTQGSNPGLQHCKQIRYHWATREASQVFPSSPQYFKKSLLVFYFVFYVPCYLNGRMNLGFTAHQIPWRKHMDLNCLKVHCNIKARSIIQNPHSQIHPKAYIHIYLLYIHSPLHH